MVLILTSSLFFLFFFSFASPLFFFFLSVPSWFDDDLMFLNCFFSGGSRPFQLSAFLPPDFRWRIR